MSALPTTLKIQRLDATHAAATSVLMQEFGDQNPLRCAFLYRPGDTEHLLPPAAALLDFASSEDTNVAFSKALRLGMDPRILSYEERADELMKQQRPSPQQQQTQYYGAPVPLGPGSSLPQFPGMQFAPVAPASGYAPVQPGMLPPTGPGESVTTLRNRTIIALDFQVCWEDRYAHDDMCAPVEIGAICFSIANRFISSFQRIISPGRVPAVVSDNAWWQTAHVHGIPADFVDAEKRYGQLWDDFCKFVNEATSRNPVNPATAMPFPPVLIAKHPRTANRCLEWMRRTAGAPSNSDSGAVFIPVVTSADSFFQELLSNQQSMTAETRKKHEDDLADLLNTPVTLDHMCKYHKSINDPKETPPQIVEPQTSNSANGAKRTRVIYHCAEGEAHLLFRTIMDLVTPATITVTGTTSTRT